MNDVKIDVPPVLINRTAIQQMLGGISRTTFYQRRKTWEQQETPFPPEVKELSAPKGGALFRYQDVIKFCHDMGLISSTHA
ncbi:helix-turn-helix domain-containing protein [Yersinia pseudotuberculosis]|uniref:hypothetical protein n=1 Tax=Yersinia pseudotuberculosis TaxID=633 RepID=UPI00040621D5|nr:hypothetical protein [Yersinia pseudotuberculosis]AJJ05981.1 hypothetical protein BZ20_3878 [Yersinia pseudotuberculosis]AYX13063.1 helix-turn-helix domain-containing protein [Yersinia pseudotuberculosis]MBO1561839.1 helix-turn-helix domain-containing protein [Yersinia pseudotuberculosis]MBO1567275.1 helix-turn-helix domain-containing protein [Yersinia pseudotuberculosis]MBO1604134.1 helix-turn-helix domain-containing protein [Yersinia pseudotuberculosis]